MSPIKRAKNLLFVGSIVAVVVLFGAAILFGPSDSKDPEPSPTKVIYVPTPAHDPTTTSSTEASTTTTVTTTTRPKTSTTRKVAPLAPPGSTATTAPSTTSSTVAPDEPSEVCLLDLLCLVQH